MTLSKIKSNNKAIVLIGCSLITVGSLGTATFLLVQKSALEDTLAHERTALEKVMTDHRSAQKQYLDSRSLLDQERQSRSEAMNRIAALEMDLSLTEARASSLERTLGRNTYQNKELADLRKTAQDLRDQLGLASELELDLRTAADRAKADRDLLAHQLEEREAGARMVNNAELAAFQGKKGKLTIKARRTNEIHMAFDLPGSLASGAHFTMTSPKGKHFSSTEPEVSASRGMTDATASVGLMAEPDATNTSRVDLKFRPKEKLEPGVYRIEVRSGKDYLQTVFLNLR